MKLYYWTAFAKKKRGQAGGITPGRMGSPDHGVHAYDLINSGQLPVCIEESSPVLGHRARGITSWPLGRPDHVSYIEGFLSIPKTAI